MIEAPRLAPPSPETSFPSKFARPQENGSQQKDLWSSMLDSVASGKQSAEKNLLVLGGTPEAQREFLEILASDDKRKPQDRHRRKPPVANEFALGYTYQDVLDADHEDVLAQLSIYLLSEPKPSFTALLRPLFSPRTLPDTLIVLLLNWSEPWHWARQLQDWIRLLRGAVSSSDAESKETMDEIMREWQQRKRGPASTGTGVGGSSDNERHIVIPLGQGEWDEGFGLPLCCVCHNAGKIESLEIEQGWREDEFDFILQFLRTVALKHGASLIYSSLASPNCLPTLIHASLGIQSLLKKGALKHNVVDRDHVLVPPNWDSWGKIRVVREGFDVERVSAGWSMSIRNSSDESLDNESILSVYEDTIRDPRRDRKPNDPSTSSVRIETESTSNQDFLASQLEVIERLKAEEERSSNDIDGNNGSGRINKIEDRGGFLEERSGVNDQIGPVQFNMGGIQVDADDMMKNLLKDRVPKPVATTPLHKDKEKEHSTAKEKEENEALSAFFEGLMKRGGSNSPRTPRG